MLHEAQRAASRRRATGEAVYSGPDSDLVPIPHHTLIDEGIEAIQVNLR